MAVLIKNYFKNEVMKWTREVIAVVNMSGETGK